MSESAKRRASKTVRVTPETHKRIARLVKEERHTADVVVENALDSLEGAN